MSDHEAHNSSPIDSNHVLKDDETFVTSDSTSISTADSTSKNTDDAFQHEVDEAVPNEPQDLPPEADEELPNEPQDPMPEVARSAGKGFARPRRVRTKGQAQAKQEQALTDSISEELRKLRDTLRDRHTSSGSSADTTEISSGLTDRLSALKPDPETDGTDTEPASSTNGQNQEISADKQSSSQQLGQDFARQNASNQNLHQSLADSKARTENQPPADHCSARLHDLKARLEQKHSLELKQQAARMFEGFKKFAEFWQAENDAELDKAAAKATAKASEEKQRSQETMSRMEKELAATYAELEMHEEVARKTRLTIQALQNRERELGEEKSRLFHSKKELEVSLNLKTKDCRNWSVQAKVLKASLRRTEQTMEATNQDAMNMAEAKEVAEAETRILHAANLALGAEKRELEEKARSATAESNAVLLEMNRCQTQSQLLTADIQRVGDRLAEREVIIKRGADEIRELKESMDRLLKKREKREKAVRKWASPPRESPVVQEVEKGERATNHFLGLSKSIFQPRSPFWGALALLVLVLALAFMAASAANRERQIWQRIDEVTRRAVISLRAGQNPELLWQDPLLGLSRGMYGV
ncbi:hypothetical protein MMC07_000622 [Pseudocyphellaria aurata]|nr:hypothetical protein [Pseudocyphellaria aurata]